MNGVANTFVHASHTDQGAQYKAGGDDTEIPKW